MSKAVLSLGSNMGDSKNILKMATDVISKLPKTKLLKKSCVYITKPWGYENQPDFYNSAVLIETELSPNVLLGACLGVETTMGRIRTFPNAPRILDVDIIAYENVENDDDELKLPHPLFKKRAFVLVPLKDLFENFYMFGDSFKKDFEKIKKEDIVGKG